MARPAPITITWKRLKRAWGYAHSEDRHIDLDVALKDRPERLLEIAIHEVAHIELPDIDETAIKRLGQSAADVLLRLGFTKRDSEEE